MKNRAETGQKLSSGGGVKTRPVAPPENSRFYAVFLGSGFARFQKNIQKRLFRYPYPVGTVFSSREHPVAKRKVAPSLSEEQLEATLKEISSFKNMKSETMNKLTNLNNTNIKKHDTSQSHLQHLVVERLRDTHHLRSCSAADSRTV